MDALEISEKNVMKSNLTEGTSAPRSLYPRMRNGSKPRRSKKMNDLKNLDYKRIKRWLRQGDITELARKEKISRATAYKVLTGKSKNWDFLEKAYEKAIQNAAKFHDLNKRLNNI